MLTSLILYIHFYDFIIMQPGGERIQLIVLPELSSIH